MKKTIKSALLLLACISLFSAKNVFAQSTPKTETFKVYGNCEMCESKIEGALKKKDGILKKDWSPKTKILSVTYDPSKVNLHGIKQKIADVGYDTDEIRAKDEVYSGLHKCCQYQRAKN
jgi:periplasmic mercuric ion binding protein